TIEAVHLDLLNDSPLAPGAKARPPGLATGNQNMRVIGLTYRQAVDEYSRSLVQQVLQTTEGNQAAAARLLQLDSGNFNRLLKRLGLKAS
ncbi:MAG TPA: helix-turn-helix domain-containing protein, partial [Limnobacter sp.]|nr:helix-turn-helix domain-containing protein [Limnobacter sp.]